MYEICKTRFGKITIEKKTMKTLFYLRDDMLKVSSIKCQDRSQSFEGFQLKITF